MLGLKRGTVKMVPHQKQWVRSFEAEKKRLATALGATAADIQHVGSTTIPGIQAKPIIDISIGIRSMKDAGTLAKSFKKLGYEQRSKSLFVKGPERRRTHYVHVMKYKGAMWNRDILFRDFLHSNKKCAKQYETLKKKLAKQFPDDRASYTKGKEKFIRQTLKAAAEKERALPL